MTTNRRQHERRRIPIEFNCYHEGRRFDAMSVDLSLGGAFLQTSAQLPEGSVVLIVPTKTQKNSRYRKAGDLPVLIAGVVVRVQKEPFQGLAVEWIKCVSRAGIQPLYDFLAFMLGRFPHTLPLPDPVVSTADRVAFNFRRNEFQLINGTKPKAADLPGDVSPDNKKKEPPEKPFGPITEQNIQDPGPPRNPGPGRVTDILGEHGGRVSRPTKVTVLSGKNVWSGIVKDIGLTTLNVAISGEPRTELRRMSICLPIPLRRKQVDVTLDCQVDSMEFDPGRKATWYELFIDKVGEGDAAGIFQRFIKYLFERELFQSPQKPPQEQRKKTTNTVQFENPLHSRKQANK